MEVVGIFRRVSPNTVFRGWELARGGGRQVKGFVEAYHRELDGYLPPSATALLRIL